MLASDIDANMLAAGGKGIYTEDDMPSVPAKLRSRWFVARAEAAGGDRGRQSWRSPPDCANSLFSANSICLATGRCKACFQVIFCRNAVIYFEEADAEQALEPIRAEAVAGGRDLHWSFRTDDRRRRRRLSRPRASRSIVSAGEERMRPVRVLIVDDSPTMRSLIRHAAAAIPAVEVVGEAGDPHEARAAIKALNPTSSRSISKCRK